MFYNPNDRRIYRENYDCIHCGRDVRMTGGRSDATSAICNRCLGIERRYSVVNDCDACHLRPHNNHVIRVHNMPRISLRRLETGTVGPLEETRVHLCNECMLECQTNANEVLAPFAINSCDNCMDYFKGVPYRMTMGDTKKDWCGSCMIKFIKSFISLEFIPVGSKITRSVRNMMGDIEFKNNTLYVWNPKKVVLTREEGHYMSMEIETTGSQHGDLPLHRDVSNTIVPAMINMLIKDGNIIWMARECVINEYTIDSFVHRRMLGGMDLYGEPMAQSGIKLRLSVQHINFKLEDQAQQEVAQRTAQRDLERLAHEGERVNISPQGLSANRRFTLPLGNHDISRPYYDRDGRILVNCSCGYQRRMHIPRSGVFTHQGGVVVINNVVYNPGSFFRTDLGNGHVVTVRSSIERRDDDLADLR